MVESGKNLDQPQSTLLTEADRECLRRVLRREPEGSLEVSWRTQGGAPGVVKVYPMLHTKRRGKMLARPNPNLFWLACPDLLHDLSTLEHHGGVKYLEARLEENPEAQAQYEAEHRRYLLERWETLSSDDQVEAVRMGYLPVYRERGIGGIANWKRVKCLHLHYGHHLARGSVLGPWIAELLKDPAPLWKKST